MSGKIGKCLLQNNKHLRPTDTRKCELSIWSRNTNFKEVKHKSYLENKYFGIRKRFRESSIFSYAMCERFAKEIFERNQIFKILNSFESLGKVVYIDIKNRNHAEKVSLIPPFQNFSDRSSI